MIKKIKPFIIILAVMIISCKNQNKEIELPNSERNEIVNNGKVESQKEEATLDTLQTIEQLQGKWKENEYPFRTAEFKNSTVKFIQEGLQNEPKFENFEISNTCNYNNDNIRDLKPEEIILSLPETNRCEKLQVSNDTLILSGFSTNTNKKYKIIYLKLK